MNNFSVIYRNPGHWDIINLQKRRLFRIRGGPGKYRVIDERPGSLKDNRECKTVQACMGYICDELMYELIIVEGQEPEVIAGWNVGVCGA